MRWIARSIGLVLLAGLLGGTAGYAPSEAQVSATGVSVTYARGWNLVSTPPGTAGLPPAPFYALLPGDPSYELAEVPPTSEGYLAYFPASATVSLGPGSHVPVAVPAPAGQWVTIGNPSGTTPAAIMGASIALAYDPTAGYRPVSVLAPGQGAWAVSFNGGLILVSPPGAEAIPSGSPFAVLAPEPATFAPPATTTPQSTPPPATRTPAP
jgi:hypothetical protein